MFYNIPTFNDSKRLGYGIPFIFYGKFRLITSFQHFSFCVSSNTDSKVLKADSYSFMKTSAYKAMNGYVAKEAYKQQLEEEHQTINSIRDLETALGDSFPRYDFDFVGPIPSLTMTTPNLDRISSLKMEGFSFSPVITSVLYR